MRAVYIDSHGGPDVLRYGERPTPRPRSGQVLIEVHAAGVNPRDWMLREAQYIIGFLAGRPPIILGSDVSGVVAAVGARVRSLSVGDEVFAMQSHLGKMGAYAEFCAVNATCVAHKPSGVDHIAAAAAPVAALTAWQALFDLGNVAAGSHVTVVGAAGGVGHYAVQLARNAGAHVTAVCGPDNADFVRELGAADVVDYTALRWPEVVRGQDLVFDTIGQEGYTAGSACLRPAGTHITTMPAPREFATVAHVKMLRLVRAGTRAAVVAVQPRGRDLTAIGALLADGSLRSVIDSEYPLAQAAEAQERSRAGHARGKIVLRVR